MLVILDINIVIIYVIEILVHRQAAGLTKIHTTLKIVKYSII